MELMTRQDFDAALNGPHRNYYLGRWQYLSVVIDILTDLQPAQSLELGPGYIPVVKDGDIMLSPEDDQFGRPEGTGGRTIIHDATVKPWPIEERAYDVLIALQVFEHLDNKQSRAFREVMRVSKRAILSLPFGWLGGKAKWMHRMHRDIDRELIRDWTLGVEPVRVIEIPQTGPEFGKGPRLLYYWEFD